MKPLSILVADDEPHIRTVIRECLIDAGHEVVCAATGDETLKLLGEHHFDLLVTDVLMPDGDGLNVIMGIKKMELSVRILVISGGGKHFQAESCIRIAEGLGAHAALFKPFGPMALLGAIHCAMGEPSAA